MEQIRHLTTEGRYEIIAHIRNQTQLSVNQLSDLTGLTNNTIRKAISYNENPWELSVVPSAGQRKATYKKGYS